MKHAVFHKFTANVWQDWIIDGVPCAFTRFDNGVWHVVICEIDMSVDSWRFIGDFGAEPNYQPADPEMVPLLDAMELSR